MKRNSVFLSLFFTVGCIQAQTYHKPNVIIIFTDDQGYQDLGCYGSLLIKTPCIDRMADEGTKFTDFYVSASVSSASRAGLLTGRMNNHNGVTGVFWPGDKGLPADEITLAESLKEQGYATACFGKWHLGDAEGHFPNDQGFDYYYGMPYSNDMYIGATQKFAKKVKFLNGTTRQQAEADQKYVAEHQWRENQKKLGGKMPMMENGEIIEYPTNQETTTFRYFDKAIKFIKRHRNEPFFCYITPQMPHTPLHVSDRFKDRSARGLYGDAVEEIDWNVGRLLDFLDKKGLSENTIVIFTSDNGPWTVKKEQGGSAAPLRDGKFSHYEGGVRTPFILRWKGTVPAGVTCRSMLASIDLFPTIMHYAGVDTLTHRIDGINQSVLFENPALSIRDEYVYVKYGKVHGIRKGDWVYLPHTGKNKPADTDGPELFNVREDVSEAKNLHIQYPEKVKELKTLMQKYLTGSRR